MTPDSINGLFELLGGIFILLSCGKLYRQKLVRGVNAWHLGYFAVWGLWNLYYYPSLGQWQSFVGGLVIVLVNFLYVAMLVYYQRKELRYGYPKT